MSLSLNRFTLKLKMLSAVALEEWSSSLSAIVSTELLEVLKQKLRLLLDKIDQGLITELGPGQPGLIDEGIDLFAGLDEQVYLLIKSELARTFKQQIDESGFELDEKIRAEAQVDFMVSLFEDMLFSSFISALLRQAEKLKVEKVSIQKMRSDATELIEREGQRLAFDLHDGPAQAISSALLQADILEDLVGSTEAKRELESLKHILGQCLQELRASIYQLKPHSLSRKGLVEKVSGYAKQFSSRVGIDVSVDVESAEIGIPEVVEINAFRVIQEALTNVQKHAQAQRVALKISFAGSIITCTVEDDGTGFNASSRDTQAKELGGYGLISMKDRVEQFSGTFEVTSRPGVGTRIRFSIPL